MKRKNLITSVTLCLFLTAGLASYAGYQGGKLTTQSRQHPVPVHRGVDESKPLDDQKATVVLDGRIFEVPLMFIQSRSNGTNAFKDSVLLEVIWPEMRSVYELKDRAEYERLQHTEHKLGWILLESATTRPALDAQVSNVRLGYTEEKAVGIEGGLEKSLTYHGLKENPTPWRELYLGKDQSGHIETRIECSFGPNARFPMCSHDFVNDGISYRLSYNKAVFFSQWREQRERAIQFLRSFEVHNDKQP